MAFHPAAPILIAGAVLGGFEDGFYYRPLQGLIDLLAEFAFEREDGGECVAHNNFIYFLRSLNSLNIK